MHCRAADSIGIKAEGRRPKAKVSGVRRIRKQSGGLFSRQTRKHGGPKRRLWRKMHIGIDEETLEVRAIKVTGSNIGPSRQISCRNRLPGNGRAHSARSSGPDPG
ncbi:hypothetical protein PhaeoP78_01134 [Phaeobacter inhibens]|nr:hypothetical protein PhaeoP78_01134 [Phaeobacter inhibens]